MTTELQDRRVPAVRAAELVRDGALLAGAAALLAHRLGHDRLRGTTDDIARRRIQLLRLDGPSVSGSTHILDGADSAALVGTIIETWWIERPEAPHATALTTSGVQLRLPHKRFETRGIMPGMAFWAAGRVKRDFPEGGDTTLEVEAEGPGQHATSVFQDWVATEVRGSFDRFPGSLRLAAELPNTVQGGISQALRSHLPPARRRRED